MSIVQVHVATDREMRLSAASLLWQAILSPAHPQGKLFNHFGEMRLPAAYCCKRGRTRLGAAFPMALNPKRTILELKELANSPPILTARNALPGPTRG